MTETKPAVKSKTVVFNSASLALLVAVLLGWIGISPEEVGLDAGSLDRIWQGIAALVTAVNLILRFYTNKGVTVR